MGNCVLDFSISFASLVVWFFRKKKRLERKKRKACALKNKNLISGLLS
jgi:hypothetical protein